MATPTEERRTRSRRQAAETARPARKSAQMIFRLTPAMKELFEEAAEVTGRSVTDFVTEAARERAIQVVRDHQDYVAWKLAGEDARAFAKAITGQPKPNPRLEAAFAKYRQMNVLRRPAEPLVTDRAADDGPDGDQTAGS